MDKRIKILKVMLICFISFLIFGCTNTKDNNSDYEVDYLENTNFDYSTMDSFSCYTINENVQYNYTFYLEDDKVINAMVEVHIDDKEQLDNFKEKIEADDNYNNVSVSEGTVKYFHNIETFPYTNYKKDILINYLKDMDYIFND